MTTITTKDSAEAKSLGKQGTQSQVPAGKSAEGGRSNPVCLELGVTIRSLPTENGAATKPIRVEGRTVIVFDNGAVLRCAENLPVGQSFILSNPNEHDVVCIVVGGRNLPSVKGYVEVQFTEAVKDFWGIHDSAPTLPAVATVPEPRRDAAQQTAAIGTRVELPAKNPNMQAGNAPSFDDIGGLLSSPTAPIVPERKAPSAPPSERAASTVSSYSQSGISTPGLVANITSSEAEQQEEKNAKQAVAEALSNALASGPMAVANAEVNQVPTSNAFARKGLMAYDQGETKAAFLGGRMPMIGGAIALVLVGIGVGAFVMNRGSSPAPAAVTAAVTEPASTPASTASSNPGLPSDSAAGTSEDTARLSAQNAAVELNNGGASLSAIPAVVSNSGSHDSKLDKEDSRGPDSSEKLRTQSAVSATRHPSIASLKMSAPSAPKRKPSDLGAGAASLTDMVADQPVANAGLLTASGRTSMQPAPPPGTVPPVPVPAAVQPTAVKTVAPRLISSVHLSYPASAKQTGIQGTVTVIASVDANGTVSSAKALNGPLLLRQSAVDSVKQWKYSPGLADGRPVASQVTVSLEFKLN